MRRVVASAVATVAMATSLVLFGTTDASAHNTGPLPVCGICWNAHAKS